MNACEYGAAVSVESRAQTTETHDFSDVILRIDGESEPESVVGSDIEDADADWRQRVDLGAVDRVEVQIVAESSAQGDDKRTEEHRRHHKERCRSRQLYVIAVGDVTKANLNTESLVNFKTLNGTCTDFIYCACSSVKI